MDSARNAFNNVWRGLNAADRGRMMSKLADIFEANIEWLSYWETVNNGKPLSACLAEDMACSVMILRHFAGYADKIKGKTLQMMSPFIGMTIK